MTHSRFKIPHCHIEWALKFVRHHKFIIDIFSSDYSSFNRATGSIVETGFGLALVTCRHVLEKYVELGERGRIQLGSSRMTVIMPSNDRIKLSDDCDLGLVILDQELVAEHKLPTIYGGYLCLTSVVPGDFVAFAGYPSDLFVQTAPKVISVKSSGVFGVVRTVQDDQFSLLVNPDEYEGNIPASQPKFELGGISGAPVFRFMEAGSLGFTLPALVGWVHQGAALDKDNAKYYATHLKQVVQWFWTTKFLF